jgi:hypothetical protein
MRPLYIFDIDGTLCNIEHRLHFLDNKADKERWKKFYKACFNDVPNRPIIAVMNTLRMCGADVWLFSGRSEDVRVETIAWLHDNTCFSKTDFLYKPELLNMRPSQDFTEDDVMKEQWLHGMLQVDRDRLLAVFDDRQRVVDMWRANGVVCCQVAQGNF